jgi:hypothetical protein
MDQDAKVLLEGAALSDLSLSARMINKPTIGLGRRRGKIHSGPLRMPRGPVTEAARHLNKLVYPGRRISAIRSFGQSGAQAWHVQSASDIPRLLVFSHEEART